MGCAELSKPPSSQLSLVLEDVGLEMAPSCVPELSIIFQPHLERGRYVIACKLSFVTVKLSFLVGLALKRRLYLRMRR